MDPFTTSSKEREYKIEIDGVIKTCSVSYPSIPPTEVEDKLLAYSPYMDTPRVFLCSGCSDQECALNRCHGGLLSKRIHHKYPEQKAPITRGLQNVVNPVEIVARVDDPCCIFISRRPPRGMPTKSIGVKKTLSRSKYANPFIVKANNFKLGESLSLYEKWIENDYIDLSDQDMIDCIKAAPLLAETVEELLITMPHLFH